MPVFATLLALSFLTHLPGQAQDRDGSVVGLWLAERGTKGGLGNWVELRADGTAAVSFGTLVQGTYTMEGTSLRLVIPRGEDRTPRLQRRRSSNCGSTATARRACNLLELISIQRKTSHRTRERPWSG